MRVSTNTNDMRAHVYLPREIRTCAWVIHYSRDAPAHAEEHLFEWMCVNWFVFSWWCCSVGCCMYVWLPVLHCHADAYVVLQVWLMAGCVWGGRVGRTDKVSSSRGGEQGTQGGMYLYDPLPPLSWRVRIIMFVNVGWACGAAWVGNSWK